MLAEQPSSSNGGDHLEVPARRPRRRSASAGGRRSGASASSSRATSPNSAVELSDEPTGTTVRIRAQETPMSAFKDAHDFHINELHITNVQSMVERKPDDREDLEEVLPWLYNANDYWTYHREMVQLRAPDSGGWFLMLQEFIEWLNTADGRLWVVAMSGVGKTVIASIVIDYLRSLPNAPDAPHVAVLAAYFRYTDKYTSEGVLRSFIRQILVSHPWTLPLIKVEFDKHSLHNTELSEGEALTLLQSLTIKFAKTYIVIDGVDEIVSNTEKTRVLKVLAKLERVQLLVFSRPIDPYPQLLPGSVMLEITARTDDIVKFVTWRLEDQLGFQGTMGGRGNTIRDIAEKIQVMSQGLFLIAALHVETLKGITSLTALKAAVSALPSGINTMYKKIMESIEAQSPEEARIAKRALMWVCNAYRRLHIQEVAEAIATTHKFKSLEVGKVLGKKVDEIRAMIIVVCRGLLVLETSGEVRLIHETAKQYLLGLRSPPFSGASAGSLPMITITHCLKPQRRDAADSPSFSSYALDFWLPHAEQYARHSGKELDQLLSEICAVAELPHPEIDVPPPPQRPEAHPQAQSGVETHRCPLLGYLRSSNLLPLLWYLHQPKFAHRQAALLLAVSSRNTTLVKHFLGSSTRPPINLNLPINSQGESLLHLACELGDCDITKLLLSHKNPTGAHPLDVNLLDAHGWTPLRVACMKARAAVVEVLLEDPRVDPNARASEKSWTPLMQACAKGYARKTVQVLLRDPRVDVNLQGAYGSTALGIAARNGHDEFVKALLVHPEVDVNKPTWKGVSPIMAAALNGHLKVLEVLLEDERVDVNWRDDDGDSALTGAVEKGQVDVLKALLANPRVDPNLRNKKGRTALHCAALMGRGFIARLLAQSGRVEVEAIDEEGNTPLLCAVQRQRPKGVKALLECAQVDANAHNKVGSFPLGLAAWNGDVETVMLLLKDKNVRIDERDTYGNSALVLAGVRGYPAVLKVLIEHRADVDVKDRCGVGVVMQISRTVAMMNANPELREREAARIAGCLECTQIIQALN